MLSVMPDLRGMLVRRLIDQPAACTRFGDSIHDIHLDGFLHHISAMQCWLLLMHKPRYTVHFLVVDGLEGLSSSNSLS